MQTTNAPFPQAAFCAPRASHLKHHYEGEEQKDDQFAAAALAFLGQQRSILEVHRAELRQR
jgi:hypothetical protein